MDDLAAIADRLDCVVGPLQPEAMGRDQVQREAGRVQLLQRQLAALVVVAPRGFDGDVLVGDLAEGEVGEFSQPLTLDQQGSALALERLDPQQRRDCATASGAVEGHIDPLAPP